MKTGDGNAINMSTGAHQSVPKQEQGQGWQAHASANDVTEVHKSCARCKGHAVKSLDQAARLVASREIADAWQQMLQVVLLGKLLQEPYSHRTPPITANC